MLNTGFGFYKASFNHPGLCLHDWYEGKNSHFRWEHQLGGILI